MNSLGSDFDAPLWGVTDPIHGSIQVTNLESTIVNTPHFQRLRKIKQLGNVHFVFPGAMHTRFAHGLGVMHIAGRMFDSLFSAALKKNREDLQLRELRAVVRLAGLLHDVGHGPFSHAFESCLRKMKGKELVHCQVNDLGEAMQVPRNWIKENDAQFYDDELTHEHYSFALIRHIFDRVGTPSHLAQDVCSLLDEKIAPSSEMQQALVDIANKYYECPDAESLRRCIKSVLSGELDVDRLDYLQRDSYYCGVSIASIDADFILNSIKINTNILKNQKKFIIELDRSALPAFEQVLVSRKQMFDRIYHHRVNAGFDHILEDAVSQLIMIGDDKVRYPRAIDEFILMNDEWLEQSIENAMLSKFAGSEHQVAWRLFTTRSPLKKVHEREVVNDDVTEAKKDLAARFGKDKIIVAKKLQKFTKVSRDNSLSDDCPIMVRKGEEFHKIGDVSDVLRSNVWREIKARIFVFESYKETAKIRHVSLD